MINRIRTIPKHTPSFLCEISYRAPSVPRHLKTYSTTRGKSLPRVSFTSKRSKVAGLLNPSTLPSAHLDYEYELYVHSSIQFADQEYRKLASIIEKHKLDECVKSKVNESWLPGIKSGNEPPEKPMLIDYGELKKIKRLLSDSKTYSVEKSSNDPIDTIVKNNEMELKKIFAKERRRESNLSSSVESLCESTEEVPRKEVMRRRWEEAKNKNLFHFVIDTVNDSVSLKRVEKDPENSARTEKTYRHIISNRSNVLPAHLQKHKFLPKYRHNDSIMIFYKESERAKEPAFKNKRKRLVNFKSAALELESFCLKARDTDVTKKTIIHNLLQRKTHVTSFNLDAINISALPLQELLTLYFKLKAATEPALHSVSPPELEQLDPGVVNLTFAPSEQALLAKYKSYVKDPRIFKGFWVNRPVGVVKPVCREGMGVASVADSIYVFGGYGNEKFNDLWMLQGVAQYKWTRIRPDGDQIPEGRFGHCMVSHGKNIYVHGGGSDFNTSAQMRRSLDDTWKYSVGDNLWTPIRKQKSRRLFPRVNAASAVLDSIWVIHGGCAGSRQSIYQDTIGFDLATEKFIQMAYTNAKRSVPGLVGHSMVAVLPLGTFGEENKGYWYNFHAWKIRPESPLSASKIGAYILGGIDSEGEFNEDVWIIRCNSVKTLETIKRKEGKVKFRYIIDCERVTPVGILPKPRMHQSTVYIHPYIAVFGGRNDKTAFEGDTNCLNDLCLLNLVKNEWVPLLLYGFAPIARWSAGMAINSSQKLIIFGGVTDTRYCSFNGYELETEGLKVEVHLTKCKGTLSYVEREAQHRNVLSIK
eukprot:TRINITY_DN7061_c0_g1_i13.p1 TRINITY_DN7061_c0_g1~~TRINITY_DN7061_c0_g1_i13.p1  ORF type:complete len:812 (-),score=175.15 TRINITY_DN7061_c0_g1_i13:57-2492(-)